MKTIHLFAAAAIGFAMTASTASAAIVDFTFTGTVLEAYGTDYENLFGGADLTGAAYTEFFSVDTGTAIFSGSPTYTHLDAGAYYGAPSFLDASFSVAGHMISLGNDTYLGEADGQDNQLTVTAYGAGDNPCTSACNAIQGQFLGYFSNPITSNIISQVLTNSGNVGDYGAFQEIYQSQGAYNIFLTPSSVTITVSGVSAAPEPSAWALLIAGVGVCGLTLRLGRRRGWAAA